MTACGTGLITESSTIILVPERKGTGKEQLSICMDTTGCLKETVGRVGKMLVLGFCVVLLWLSLMNLPGTLVFETRIWRWAPSTYPLNQGNLLDLGSGPRKQRQDFTLSECKLGLHGTSRALAANNKAGFRLDWKLLRIWGEAGWWRAGEESFTSFKWIAQGSQRPIPQSQPKTLG